MGRKGTTYQVRYPSRTAKTGYEYATFDTLKEARAFTENLGSYKSVPGGQAISVIEAVDRWLSICEKIGRDGREKVEKQTYNEYPRFPRAGISAGVAAHGRGGEGAGRAAPEGA